MASSHQGQSKRAAVSLEEWEAKAPLNDLELASINALKVANSVIPLPLSFSAQDIVSRPPTPILHSRQPGTPSSRPTTPRISHGHALHPKVPVQTPEQFYDWLTLIDRSVTHSQDAHFRAHVASLTTHLETCERLTDRITEVDHTLAQMYQEWWRVEENGRIVKEGCERLVDERDQLLQVMEDINEHLAYFQELDRATRMLNHPGESLIFEPDFLYMVERVDICIAFMRNHRDYREADLYLLRFQQCMTRAMTLIKMSFVGSLRALTADISKRISEKDISQTAQHHLLYTRFQSVAPKIHPLLRELERRASTYPDDLSALLSECYTAYFSARRSLLAGWIQAEIKSLDVVRSELVELTRAGCSFLKQLCTDEFNLYRSFFSTAEEELYQYLEKLCDVLYDDLRPRILHEPRLTALCQVCTVLQALMVLDSSAVFTSSSSSPSDSEASDDDESEHDASDDQLTVDLDSARHPPLRKERRGKGNKLHISRLLQMVLQDAQTRLFFKAQAMIQSEVRYHVPRLEDLRWPELLMETGQGSKMSFDLTTTTDDDEKKLSDVKSRVRLDEGGSYKGSLRLWMRDGERWYPTLRKTIWILEQLRDFVQPAIFQDIAQEALQLCHQSLVTASESIKVRQEGGRSPGVYGLDGALFLVRHLWVLKEVVVSFELGSGDSGGGGRVDVRERDESVTDTLANFLSRTSGLLPLPEGFFGTLGVGVGGQGERGELRYGIDQVFRKTCENVIDHGARVVCQVLLPWGSVPVVASSPSSSTTTGTTLNSSSGQPSSAPRLPPQQTETLFRESCTREFRNVIGKIKLYLDFSVGGGGAGIGTRGVLVRRVRERVVEGYREFLDAVGQSQVVKKEEEEEEEEEEEGNDFMGVDVLGRMLSEVVEEVEGGTGCS